MLHRAGTPGAQAAAHQLGLAGQVSVEEVLIRPGEHVFADGRLEDDGSEGRQAPFRGVNPSLELLNATVKTASRAASASAGPALILWVAGLAALVVLGGIGAAAYAASRADLLRPESRSGEVPSFMGPSVPVRPRLP